MATAFKGTPVKLNGSFPAVGSKAPDFRLTKADLSELSGTDLAGKTRILLTVPSLDTGVCATETKRFNEEAAKIPGTEVVVISEDLPFAQKRFCEAEGINAVTAASALRDKDLGQRLGVAIAEGPLEGLMARAVIVVGPDDQVKYTEMVDDITHEPNYDAALQAARG